jgi:hypothetical protein
MEWRPYADMHVVLESYIHVTQNEGHLLILCKARH